MAVLLPWGCEKALANSAVSNVPEMSTDRVRAHGTQSIKFSTSASTELCQFKKLGATGAAANLTETTLYASWYINVDVLPGGDQVIAIFGASTSDYIARVVLEADGDIVLQNEAGTKSSVAGTLSDDGLWHRIDVKWIESGTCEIRVDLGTVQTVTGSDATQSVLVLGCVSTGTCTWYLDDVVIDDAAWPASGYEIVTLSPSADGSFTSGFTGGTGSTFAEVDETPNDAYTTYWQADNATNDRFCAMANLPLTGAQILAVCGWAECKEVTTTTSSFQVSIYDGTKSSNTAANVGTTSTFLGRLLTAPPSGGSFDVTNVNALEVGMLHAAVNVATNPQVTSLWLDVLLIETLSPSGIATAEAFGTATLVAQIDPSSIASLEAFGTASLSSGAGDQNITLSGLSSAEAFGTAVLIASIEFSGIASLEAFGTAALAPGEATVSPSGVSSLEALGAAVLSAGEVVVSPSGVASLEVFGSSVLSAGEVSIQPSGIASAEAIGTATLVSQIDVNGIASDEQHGATSLQPGEVSVSPSGVASLEAFGTLRLDTQVDASGVASSEAFGSATLSPGEVTVSPSSVTSLEAFGSLALVAHVDLSGVASAEAFGDARLDSTIQASGVASLEAFGAAQLDTHLECSGIASAEAFGDATCSSGNATLSCSGIASEEAHGATVLTPEAVTIAPSSVASLETFGAATLTGVAELQCSGVASLEAFGAATCTPGTATATLSGIASLQAFGATALSYPGSVAYVDPGRALRVPYRGASRIKNTKPTWW